MKLRLSFLPLLFFAMGCAAKKPATTLHRDELVGKKVAIANVDGPKEARKHVEVALINEVIDQGRFEVLDRTSVREALSVYPHHSDWKRLGDHLKADFILNVKVIHFTVKEREGFDAVEEEDSLLTEESGASEAIRGRRYVKVKGNAGHVRLKMTFFDVGQNKILHDGYGEALETVNSRDNPKGGKMALLEKLTEKAVRNFFETLPNS